MSSDTTPSTSIGSESGIALFSVLFVTLIIGALATLMFSSAMFETRSTGDARDYEGAIHLADAGAELVFARMIDEPGWATGHYRSTPFADDAEERAWVLDQPLLADTRLDVAEGYAYGIGPVWIEDEEDLLYAYVYGVGVVGDESAPNSTRIVRTQVLPSDAGFGDAALLVEGNLEFKSGNYPITGDIHANGNISAVEGGAYFDFKDDGAISASGTITQSGGTFHPADVTKKPLAPTRPVPEHTALELYDAYVTDVAAEGKWFDMCTWNDGGTVRGRVLRGSPSGPCTGPPATGGALDSQGRLHATHQRWRGWEFHSSEGSAQRVWVKAHQTTVAEDEGVYFVHHGNVRTNGMNSSARVSIIASADPSQSGTHSGNVSLSGHAPLRYWPSMDPWAVMADRDVYSGSGGGGRVIEGTVYARGGVQLPGNTNVTGAVIAASRQDARGLGTHPPAPAKPVSIVHGSATLTYQSHGDPASGDGVHVYSWKEL